MGIGLVVWWVNAQASASAGMVDAHGQQTVRWPGRAMHHAHCGAGLAGAGVVGVSYVGHGLHGLLAQPQWQVPGGQPSLESRSAIRPGSQA